MISCQNMKGNFLNRPAEVVTAKLNESYWICVCEFLTAFTTWVSNLPNHKGGSFGSVVSESCVFLDIWTRPCFCLLNQTDLCPAGMTSMSGFPLTARCIISLSQSLTLVSSDLRTLFFVAANRAHKVVRPWWMKRPRWLLLDLQILL